MDFNSIFTNGTLEHALRNLGDTYPIQWVLVTLLGLFALWFNGALRPDLDKAVEYTVQLPEQCMDDWKGEVLKDPSIKVNGSSDIRCYCPANGRLLGYVTPATEKDIDGMIGEAQKAQREWAKTTFSQRRVVLKSMLKYVLEHQDDIATAACLDSGKTRIDALFGEILMTAEKLKWTLDHGEKSLKPESRPTNWLMMYKKNEVRYEPLGVVAACVSWNYPRVCCDYRHIYVAGVHDALNIYITCSLCAHQLTIKQFHNLLGPIISSIFAGNAIIVKGSEQTAWSSPYFVSIAREALRACGHSPKIIQSVICWPEAADYLTSHPSISHLTFIGSRTVAHAVAQSASKSLTPLCVELGGKDPAIILDDAKSDLDRIVSILMRGVFQAAGQNCIGIERIIALPNVYQDLITRVEPMIQSLRVGSALDTPLSSTPIDVGSCISPASFSRLETLIESAVRDGARLLCGGKRLHHPDHPSGHYFQPTLLVDVTPGMAIAQTETFAPIFVLMPASSPQHALEIANSTPYALGSSVFGSNAPDLDFLAANLQAGMVAINDFAAYYAVQLPFGGTKGSGYGRFAGPEGLRSVCNQKSVCRDRFGGRLLKTSIPAKLSLPASEKTGAGMWGFAKGVTEFGYGETLGRRIGGIKKMI